VAIVLSVGIVVALNVITVSVAYDAILRNPPNQITEHTTQLLLAWGGGITGIIGAIVGFKIGNERNHDENGADG